MSQSDVELFERAAAVAERAYAPYSQLQVGAAVRTHDGRIFEGVNVESGAFPLGICAERAAIARAISEGETPDAFEAIAVTQTPCGGCRQWLRELEVHRVVYPGPDGNLVTCTPEELLPAAFEL
ncbi:MAG: cytidine deaminase [Gaiellaceae bacterium]|nr:cytidine deaminase [Gaiellaceae bacterium]